MVNFSFNVALLACGVSFMPVYAQVAPNRPPAQSPTRPASAASAFAGFETRILPNGLKVWFKHAPGFGEVSVSVAVPFGADRDPPDKRSLAHLTEHMLFTDRPGLTEQDIKRALDERGGVRNGITYWDHTFYFVRVERAHGLFAVEWLYGILSPREFRPELVERQRTPVLLEAGARRRNLGDWLGILFIDPPWLRAPGYWDREFGLNHEPPRDYYAWRMIHAITPDDIRRFYERYYAPGYLTLTVIGDLPADSVWAAIDRTFARLPARPATLAAPPVTDPGRERRRYLWGFRSGVFHDERYKVYDRTARDEVLLIFVARWLDQRLGEALRFGERKAAYAMSVNITRRGNAAHLGIAGSLKKEEYEFAQVAIRAEIERLTSGTMPDSEFVARRGEIAARLRVEATSAETLERWVTNVFYDRRRFDDFPDLVGEFSALSKAEVSEFARRTLVPERRVLTISNVIPVPQPIVIALALALVALAFRLARRSLLQPLPMARLRYIARIKRPIVWRAIATLIYIATVTALLRLVVFGFEVLFRSILSGSSSLLVQSIFFAIATVLLVLLLVGAGAVVPVKLLVFDHGIALKAFAYHARFIPLESISELAMKTIPELIRESGPRALWTTRIMALAIRTPALFIRRTDGASLLVRTRDTRELMEVLSRQRGWDYVGEKTSEGGGKAELERRN